MNTFNVIKSKYIAFIENNEKNFAEKIVFFILVCLSVIFRIIVVLRSFLYEKGYFKTTSVTAKVVSVGNISWGGTGKTSLSLKLLDYFRPIYKTALLRRGYGGDEEKMYIERGVNVFSGKDRVRLAVDNQSRYDLFILDDGYQYRKLKRDINIVMLNPFDLFDTARLIPAGRLREAKSAIKRADVGIIMYKTICKNKDEYKQELIKIKKDINVYFADYVISRISDLSGKVYDKSFFNTRVMGAATAIGYPQGFFALLKAEGLSPLLEIEYPDHYDLDTKDIEQLKNKFSVSGIADIFITRKDSYRFKDIDNVLKFYIVDVEFVMEDENKFFSDISSGIITNSKVY
ncbi:MAG: tetraacyldisaccharide 4'-kinase [Candidatus Omnitrophica bacterium]|nr:tetraacyldisaccharide 4'-kinase [Candidatus Omnitrophota bacterium]MDD5081489.1 tetraacyldisaccharide 4'-kinase [Candidatus Omnitrophota bacterium]MDD5440797.1 tetraacyldisaccharide 4'-kinase [Candidatus Omnitrophota bacterium]